MNDFVSYMTHNLSHTHTHTHTHIYIYIYTHKHIPPNLAISSSQRPIPDNTQQSQQTGTHAPGGIRTHKLSRREDADLRLRPRGH